MPHKIVDLIDAWRTGVCSAHGTDSQACGAANEIATLTSSGVVGSALGRAALGEGGEVIGGAVGLLVGHALNELAESTLDRQRSTKSPLPGAETGPNIAGTNNVFPWLRT